jgi:V8-like Glu-specific endopeptidase
MYKVLLTMIFLAIASVAVAQDDSCEAARNGICDEVRYGGGALCADGTDTADCAAVAATSDCQYAFDYECDDATLGGTGACDPGTDVLDCRILALGQPDDSCPYANDNECDEPRFGAEAYCTDGTDTSDCQAEADALATLIAALPADVVADLGDDSCEFAFDGECDDPTFSGGAPNCDPGTDAADCTRLAAGGDDSCQWANDGECDDPAMGTGACDSGTDVTDCAPIEYLRGRTDGCATAYDNICDEPELGNGTCAALTDTADCMGRGRPATAGNHYYGRDDRFLPDLTAMPWRAIGTLLWNGEAGCTASLIGPDLILTAAHCVTNDGVTLALPDHFRASATGMERPPVARIIAGVISPLYVADDESEPADTKRLEGDWALLRLDWPLGDMVGVLPVHVLTEEEIARANRDGLVVAQAGYSGDTSPNLSAHEGCRITSAYDSGGIQHECDTTGGDSGSPIMLMLDGVYHVIAADSRFYAAEDETNPFPSGGLAVDSRVWASEIASAPTGKP